MKQGHEKIYIDSIEALQQEQIRLKLRIKEQEAALRRRVQQVPGELFSSGVNAIVPAVISGKIVSSVIGLGKNLVDKAFIKKDGKSNSKLITAAKQAGIVGVFKLAYRAFVKRH